MVLSLFAIQNRTRVQFTIGDACSLPQLGQFGCVFGGNLVCGLHDPVKFLNRIPSLLVPGGVLVLTSTYTWHKDYTPKVSETDGFVHAKSLMLSTQSHCKVPIYI